MNESREERISRDNAETLASNLREMARRGRGHVRSRGHLALDGLATMLEEAKQLPSASEIGAMLELIEREISRDPAQD